MGAGFADGGGGGALGDVVGLGFRVQGFRV